MSAEMSAEDLIKLSDRTNLIVSLLQNSLQEKFSVFAGTCNFKTTRMFYWLGETSQGDFKICTHPDHHYRIHHPEESVNRERVCTKDPVAFCDLRECPIIHKSICESPDSNVSRAGIFKLSELSELNG